MINKIIHFSVYHRGLVLLLTTILAVAGIYSFQHLPIDAVPDITNNQVQVNTTIEGLAPEEIEQDFAHEPLPPRPALGTVGLWCALHGEAFLAAGMHHLECQFDFEHARTQLAKQGVGTMKPFTDLPYLRQAFTEGQRWPVSESAIETALAARWITAEQAQAFRHVVSSPSLHAYPGFDIAACPCSAAISWWWSIRRAV